MSAYTLEIVNEIRELYVYYGAFAYSSGTPAFKFTDPKLARSASSIKDRLLDWVRAQTKEYKVYSLVEL